MDQNIIESNIDIGIMLYEDNPPTEIRPKPCIIQKCKSSIKKALYKCTAHWTSHICIVDRQLWSWPDSGGASKAIASSDWFKSQRSDTSVRRASTFWGISLTTVPHTPINILKISYTHVYCWAETNLAWSVGWDREWFNIDTRYSWNRAKSCTVQHTKIWLTFWSLFGIYTLFAMLKIMNFKFLSLKTPCICRAKLQVLMFLYTLPHIPVALSEYTVFTCILRLSVHILLSHASLGLKCKHCIKMRVSVNQEDLKK